MGNTDKDLALEISQTASKLSSLINLDRMRKGIKDSRFHISYERGGQTLQLGGLENGKRSRAIALEVTKW